MTVPVGGRWEGGPMRNAAHGRQDEAPQAPPRRDLQAEAAALLDRAGALVPVLETAGASTRAVNETIILALRLAELADALEGADAMEAVASAAYQQGRADAAAARDVAAAGQQAPRPRHAGSGRHLRSVPGIPVTAVRAAAAVVVAAGLGGGIVAGMHDEAAVRYAAASPAGHAALHPMAPDRAVLAPSPSWSPSPRPSMAAASARPAPVAVPSPSVPASSPPPVPVPSATVTPAPVLDVPRFLDLGDSILGQLQLSATGPGEVAWTATATDGIRLSQYAGVVVSGEPVTIQVTDPTGGGGWIYVSFGGTTIPVEVMPGLGVPALALPSGL